MTPLKEAIEQTAELAKKLLTDHPNISSISFELSDYPVEEVQQAAKTFHCAADFREASSCVGFLYTVSSNVFGCYAHIHVKSTKVKAKVVYE